MNVVEVDADFQTVYHRLKQCIQLDQKYNFTDNDECRTCMKWLMFSRSERISERFLVPSTVRSVV